MNAIFAVLFLCCTAVFLVRDAAAFMPALLGGAEKAAALSLSLLAAYCVWLGFFKVMEQSGLSQLLARRALPLTRKLFRTKDEQAATLASYNLSANLLGLPGAPTPLGIRAAERFLAEQNTFAAELLFVLNATSLQLLPTTVIALRTAASSASPADIILPTLLATLLSSLFGVLFLFLMRLRRRTRKCA